MNEGPPRHTFDHQTCDDICEKLRRESERLNSASDPEEISDHAINFALTAWHLIDWLWKEHELGRMQFKGAAKAESANWVKPGDFRDYICAQEPRIHVCGLIASTAKHRLLKDKRWPDQSEFETVVSAAVRETSTGVEQVITEWKPKTVQGDERRDFGLEAQCVLDFWSNFIHGQTVET